MCTNIHRIVCKADWGLILQNTVKSKVVFEGIGLHSGKPARIVVCPASAEYGIWFRRVDVTDRDAMIPALWHVVQQTQLCTKLVNGDGVAVSTVEHLMAALAGCGIHNALIEIEGEEVPILDGSALPFLAGLMDAGIRPLAAPVRAIRVLKTVTVEEGGARATLSPSDIMEIDFHIDFVDAAIGKQAKSLVMNNGTFARELSDSRTFCRKADVDMMQRNGLALGGRPGENAVVFDGDIIASPGGLRHDDEPVRHKMLDALGDLALAGGPVLGRYEGVRAGHSLTNALLRKLFATPGASQMVICDEGTTSNLPGVGLHQGEIPRVA